METSTKMLIISLTISIIVIGLIIYVNYLQPNMPTKGFGYDPLLSITSVVEVTR